MSLTEELSADWIITPKTAFEIVSTDLGSQGRSLPAAEDTTFSLNSSAGKDTPAVGFAAGIERLFMVMEKQQIPIENEIKPLLFIAAADETGKQWALEQAMALRRAGISCEIDLLGRSLKSQMKEADRQQSRYVVIIGEQELKQGNATAKNMSTGEQTLLALEKFRQEIPNLK